MKKISQDRIQEIAIDMASKAAHEAFKAKDLDFDSGDADRLYHEIFMGIRRELKKAVKAKEAAAAEFKAKEARRGAAYHAEMLAQQARRATQEA